MIDIENAAENWAVFKIWAYSFLEFLEESRKVLRGDRKKIDLKIDVMEIVCAKIKELEDMDD